MISNYASLTRATGHFFIKFDPKGGLGPQSKWGQSPISISISGSRYGGWVVLNRNLTPFQLLRSQMFIQGWSAMANTRAAARDLARTQLAVTFLDTIYIANYAHWTLATAHLYP